MAGESEKEGEKKEPEAPAGTASSPSTPPAAPPSPPSVSSASIQITPDRLIGETPDNELRIEPRWLLMEPPSGVFSSPLCATFRLVNLDAFPIAWCVKTKELKLARTFHSYGILKANAAAPFTILIPAAAAWANDESNIVNRLHRLVFENVRLPEKALRLAEKATEQDAVRLAKQVFHDTRNIYTFMRLYTKADYVLIKKEQSSSGENSSCTTKTASNE